MNYLDLAIIIPLFNKESEIAATLESVIRQSYRHFRVYIVDDGSTDNSLSIVESFEDERITIIRQPNKGVSAARNAGIVASGAEWIALIDADDVWGEGHIEALVSALNKNPGCDIYSSKLTRNINDMEVSSSHGKLITDYPAYILTDGWGVNSSSVLFSYSIWNRVGGFPEGETHGEDLVTWYKMSLYSDIFILNCRDVYYTPGVENSATSIVKDEEDAFVKYIDLQMMIDPAAVSGETFEIRNKMLISKGFFLVIEGKNKAARKYLRRARATKYFRVKLGLCLLVSYFPGTLARFLAQTYLNRRNLYRTEGLPPKTRDAT